MQRTFSLGFVVALSLSFVVSCSDDDAIVNGLEPPPYKNLSGERDNVLFNLQKAYNERNFARYDELLDADFVFFFSNTDYQMGKVQYLQWGRAAELGSAKNLFDPTYSKPPLEPVSDIDLALTYATGEDKWVEVPSPDPVKWPDETWYEKVVTYALTVKSGTTDVVGNNIQARFTVRWAADQVGKKYWRIVLWRDDTGSRRGNLPALPEQSALSEMTWGRVKAVYSQ